MFENFEMIHRYSRADAIRDGVLIDVSATAREAGIRWPVALSRAVWERCVRVPDGVVCQDEAGRLWDVLWMLLLAARRCEGAEVRFGVHVRNDNREGVPPLVRLKALAGHNEGASLPWCRVRRCWCARAAATASATALLSAGLTVRPLPRLAALFPLAGSGTLGRSQPCARNGAVGDLTSRRPSIRNR
jgi:hypothetical protein